MSGAIPIFPPYAFIARREKKKAFHVFDAVQFTECYLNSWQRRGTKHLQMVLENVTIGLEKQKLALKCYWLQ
jgi:hypothetical protein